MKKTSPSSKSSVLRRVKLKTKDEYQTPPRYLDLILQHARETELIWEPFTGPGFSTKYMRDKGYKVTNSDAVDFFDQSTPQEPYFVVTNPPFSIKKEIISNLLQRGCTKAAILLPETVIYTRYLSELCKKYNISPQFIFLKRIPYLDEEGKRHKKTPSFYSFYLTWGLNLPRDVFLPEF